jgi:hypothetical protein
MRAFDSPIKIGFSFRIVKGYPDPELGSGIVHDPRMGPEIGLEFRNGSAGNGHPRPALFHRRFIAGRARASGENHPGLERFLQNGKLLHL